MKKYVLNNKGFVDNILMLLIALFILVFLFVNVVGKLDPIVKYISLNQIVRKYTLKMETEGGLTAANLNNLKNELTAKGFNISKTTITATNTAGYGEDLTLEITYSYQLTKKSIDGLSITTAVKNLPMKVSKSTTSKKG